MCGIIGIVSNKNAEKMALESLALLEYRGYDSAGIAKLSGKEITTTKSLGEINNLRKAIGQPDSDSKMGRADD